MLEPLVIVRAVHFAACLAALGTAAFATLVPDRALDRRWRWLAAAALAVAVVSGAIWFALIAGRILDVPLGDLVGNADLATVATDTRFGRVALLRLALAAAAAAALLSPRWRWPALTASAALTGAIAWTGHAGAGTGVIGAVHLASDVVHLIAAGLWLGALPALAGLLLWSRKDPTRAALAAQATRRFSRLAVASVAAVATSGLVNSAVLVGWPDDLLGGTYGRVLALKVALFAAMLGFAAVNRFRLTPRLPERTVLRAIAVTTLTETALGIGILVLVGLLGTLPPASHVHRQAAAVNPDAAIVHIHTAEVMADLSIDPGHAGVSTATVRLWHEDFSAYAAERVQLALEPTFSGAVGLKREARQLSDGTWEIAELNIQPSGVWTAKVIIERQGASTVLDGPIVITQCSNDCR